MLRFLAIQRLAVVDALEIEFAPGLNILTGETGAGKSIVTGALGLLAGGRASSDVVRSGEESATIQAIFESADGRERLIRRDISAQGRSRAFIDGTLVTAGVMKQTLAGLVDLHGQHEHQALLDARSHRGLLDAYARLSADVDTVAERHGAWASLRRDLDCARAEDRQKTERLDLVTYQLGEIDRVHPTAGEDAALGAAQRVLANADRLQRLSREAYQVLYEQDAAILSELAAVWKRVDELASLDARVTPYVESREAIMAPLQDLAFFLRTYSSSVEASPDRLQEIESRLAALERLKRKHGPTLAEVLARQAALRQELRALEGTAERVVALEAELNAARDAFLSAATDLSNRRRAAAATLSPALERALAELAMARTRVDVRVRGSLEEADWSPEGLDDVELFLSANPGEEPRPLAKIASGGELSRVMLALKTLASTDQPGKTLVFDEVDAGIGGHVADVVGERLRALGENFQVLCVTHLPQIAAHGGVHFQVSKQVTRGRTTARVARLDDDGRVEEIARMIGGLRVTESVRASARELLDRRRHGEQTTKGESERAKTKGARVG